MDNNTLIFFRNDDVFTLDKGLLECTFLSLRELISKTKKFIAKKVGILWYHQYHNTEKQFKILNDYLKHLNALSGIQSSIMGKRYLKFGQL